MNETVERLNRILKNVKEKNTRDLYTLDDSEHDKFIKLQLEKDEKALYTAIKALELLLEMTKQFEKTSIFLENEFGIEIRYNESLIKRAKELIE